MKLGHTPQTGSKKSHTAPIPLTHFLARTLSPFCSLFLLRRRAHRIKCILFSPPKMRILQKIHIDFSASESDVKNTTYIEFQNLLLHQSKYNIPSFQVYPPVCSSCMFSEDVQKISSESEVTLSHLPVVVGSSCNVERMVL